MTKFKNVRKGDVLSETQFYTVNKVVGNDVELENDLGETIVVNNKYVEACLFSTQFEKEEKITRTELAQKFLASANVALEVTFTKQVKEADVVKEITEAYSNSTPKEFEAKMKKAVKGALNGETRVLRGRHSGSIDDFGRVHVVDMEIVKDGSKSYDVRQRLVDPRTISQLIVKGIKYTEK